MKMKKRLMACLLAAGMALSGTGTALADNTYSNGGYFSDPNTLTWEWNDGTVVTYGRGTVFSDVHPEITDPEYYLKELTQYPGETGVVYNSQGNPKANYSDEAVRELQKFVNSFDWIHSDELTRAETVFNRIANGFSGNYYKASMNPNWCVLLEGHGVCKDFAEEFATMCRIVGLECVTYTPSYLHEACLLKIGNQWYAVDPTSGAQFYSDITTHPVDYETELHRYENEAKAEREQFMQENPDDPTVQLMIWNQQLSAGEITLDEFNARYNALVEQYAK